MRFKPRYSLLTLLVFMAFVAVALRFWQGPHHVIEKTSSTSEEEYTYTRDLIEKKIHGVKITRTYDLQNQLSHVGLKYYRHGFETKHDWELYAFRQSQFFNVYKTFAPVVELNEDEQMEFQNALDQERSKIKKLGLCLCEPSYLDWRKLQEILQRSNDSEVTD